MFGDSDVALGPVLYVICSKVLDCWLVADGLFTDGDAVAWRFQFSCFGEVIVGAGTSLEGAKD